MPRALKINEIFFSIQGESTHAGRPCIFVRLSACPLRCTYCDTEYAFYEGKLRGFDEIFAELKKFPTRLVEVTGGEPLAQPAVLDFMRELIAQGYELLLETSGAFPIDKVPPEVQIIMDIKTPDSGEHLKNHWDNIASLRKGRDEVKFVLGSKDDFAFACAIVEQHKLFEKATVLASPVFGKVENLDLANWILESGYPFRMQLQMHKYIWAPTARGV